MYYDVLSCTMMYRHDDDDDGDPLELFQVRGKWWELIVTIPFLTSYYLKQTTLKLIITDCWSPQLSLTLTNRVTKH